MSYVSEVMADSPAGYWRMNDVSAFPQDSSGNGNHINETFGDGHLYGEPGAIASDPASGSVYADFQDLRMSADSATLDLGDTWTTECWARRSRDLTQEWMVCKGIGAYSMLFGDDDTVKLSRFATSEEVASTVTVIDDGIFHHIVGVSNGATSMAIYIDGVDRTGTVTNATYTNTNVGIALGSTGVDGGGGGAYMGWLAEMAVYPTVLSAARVLAHFEAATEVGTGFGQLGSLSAIGF